VTLSGGGHQACQLTAAPRRSGGRRWSRLRSGR
jgi:hypothetical protein